MEREMDELIEAIKRVPMFDWVLLAIVLGVIFAVVVRPLLA
jgi:hypothetical protein